MFCSTHFKVFSNLGNQVLGHLDHRVVLKTILLNNQVEEDGINDQSLISSLKY